jgi:hypothetical protein
MSTNDRKAGHKEQGAVEVNHVNEMGPICSVKRRRFDASDTEGAMRIGPNSPAMRCEFVMVASRRHQVHVRPRALRL